MNITFDPEAHAYTLDGADVPSVTQVLSAEGLSGDGNGFWKESDRQRGSAVHRIALLLTKRPWRGTTHEEIVDNSLWDPAATASILIPYGMAAARYLADSGFRPIHAELPVASAKLRIAGTLDVWGNLPSGVTQLIDWKSGQPSAAADIQTAIYAALLEEHLGLKTDQRVVVWLQSSGQYKASPPRQTGGQDLAIGMAAVSLYHWRRKYKMLG